MPPARQASRKACPRAEREPSNSPNSSRCIGPVWRITPGPIDRRGDVADAAHDLRRRRRRRAGTRPSGRRSGTRRRPCRGPTIGRICASAASVSHSLTQSITRSTTPICARDRPWRSTLRHVQRLGPFDAQALRAHRLQVPAARDEMNVGHRRGQARAEVAAQSARSHDRDAHVPSPPQVRAISRERHPADRGRHGSPAGERPRLGPDSRRPDCSDSAP